MTHRKPAEQTFSAAELGARIAALHGDPRECATAAGLVYMSHEQPGIRRQRRGRGFGYQDAKGRRLTDKAVKARIAALAIPPAWRNVWICPDADGHMLAVGEDDRGRTQYIYHPRWRELRDLLNFYRQIAFAQRLPAIRAQVEAQLRRHTMDRPQVLATMVRLVDVGAIRIGGEVYAEENDSFGLSTLTRRHVAVTDDEIRLKFVAKSGKLADLVVHDRAAARVVRRLAEQRTKRLFTVDKKPIDAAEVNVALADWTGVHVTAKDFRTWHGTLAAFACLEDHVDAAQSERSGLLLAAVDAAAEKLGNTRAVARAHYVHPHLLTSFADGTFEAHLAASAPRRVRLLDGAERRLLAFLEVALERDLDATSIGLR